MTLTFARDFKIGSKPTVRRQPLQSASGMGSVLLTPIRSRYNNAVAVIADSVYDVLDCICSSCSENDMLRLHRMNRFEVGVEEGGKSLAK